MSAQENFAITLTDQTTNHQEWLAVVRYGLETLLKDPPLLVEIIVREAERELQRCGIESHVTADHARAIFKDLGLRLTVSE